MPTHDSPRIRRLRNDLIALERLAAESSVFRFKSHGNPPVHYAITFHGKGLCRDRGKIKVVYSHELEIKLGASYPRTIPEIRWLSPVYHPNISEIGLVCLGGYGTHWVPSVQLDELCTMLWDMARYHNYDIRSPYNRDAALWVANQTSILFPTDGRAIRDLRAAQGRIEEDATSNGKAVEANPRPTAADRSAVARVRQFLQGRYGKVFEAGGTGPAAPAAPPPAREAGPSQAQEPVGSLLGDPRPEPAEPVAPEPTPALAAAPAAPAEVAAASTDDFVFLAEDPALPAEAPSPSSSQPVAPAGEDILFIE